MGRTVCIIQARMNSKRLPGKVLLPLNGHTVIGEVLTRCKRIPGVDEVVCATTMLATDQVLADEAAKYCKVVTGSENDVLWRYLYTAQLVGADIIMRITGDCPLISPELCGQVLEDFKATEADYGSNIEPRTFPRGLDCEVFTFDILKRAHEHATVHEGREHVTPWIQANARKKVSVQSKWHLEGRLCIDTKSDYEVIRAHFDNEPYQHIRAA